MSLILYYPFNENSGNIVSDNSGNGNNGNLVSGVTWYTSGKIGSAAQFISGHINCSTNFTLTELTLASWVNLNTKDILDTDDQEIIIKNPGIYDYHLNVFGTWRGADAGKVEGGSSLIDPPWLTGTTSIIDNTWHHLAFTYDGIIKTIYIDGVAQNTAITTSNGLYAASGALSVGGGSDNSRQSFGLIDDVRIYNQALTSSEIRNLYKTTSFFKYRLQSVEYSEVDDAMTLELSDVDEFLLGNIAELNKKMDINNVYGQGATNIYQVGPVIDNFQRISGGANYKTTLMIYIPTEAITINKVFLNWRLTGYRTFTAVASQTTGNPSATHTHSVNIDNSMDTGNNCHLVGFQGNVVHVVDGGFAPTTWGTNSNTADHTHQINISQGIGEEADESPTLQLDVNNVGVAAYIGNQSDIDITDFCNTGWNTVDLYVSTDVSKKGRIQLDGFVQCFIESK